jgi:hypothetical protein
MVTPHSIASTFSAPRLAITSLVRRLVSFPVFLGALLFGGACMAAHFRFVDPDTWWHIKVGEQILRTHHWPLADPYSFTVGGAHWIAYEWLGEVVLAVAARFGEFTGLAVLQFLWAGTLMLLLWYYVSIWCENIKSAFLACAMVLPITAAFFTLRPQVMGYIFLLITLIALERFRRGKTKSLWWLPALFLVWVNTHGTFVFGLVVMGNYWLGGLLEFSKGGLAAQRWTPAQRRHLLLVVLLCVAVLPLTPYGAQLAAYPFEMALLQPLNVANIMEWQPMSFDLLYGKVILVALLAFFVFQVVYRLSYRLEVLALLLMTAFAACAHIRFILFFLFSFTPILAQILARWTPRYQPEKNQPALNLVIMLLVLTGGAYYLSDSNRPAAAMTQTYPVKAVEYLRDHPVSVPMFNSYGWGGYLIRTRGPAHKVFIDGRADIYEYAGVLTDYMHISWLESDAFFLLRKYSIGACLIETRSPLSTVLAALPDWRREYADDVAVLYLRKETPPVPIRTK